MKVPAIFDWIRWSENFNQLLDSVKNDFGSKFILTIFHHKIESGNNNRQNLLLYTSKHGENLPKFLKWIRLNIVDLEFLEKQIFSIDEIDNFGILHYAFRLVQNRILLELLDELENWRSVLGKNLIQKFILMESENHNHFLFYYVHNENFDTDFLIEFLGKLKIHFENEEGFLSDIMFHGDDFKQTFLHVLCALSCDFDLFNFLRWFHNDFGTENLKKLLLLGDDDQKSFIFNYFSNVRIPISSCFEILHHLKVKLNFDENFLKHNLILEKTSWNENILQVIFLRSENFDEFNDFVENQFKISDSELRLSFVGSSVSSFSIAQKSEEDQYKYLEYMKCKFGENILQEIVSSESLFNICLQNLNTDSEDFASKIFKFFDFIERELGIDFVKQSIIFKYSKNQTFLFPLCEFSDSLIKIFDFLLKKFANEKDFLAELLLSVDDFGNTFLIHYFLVERFPIKMTKISKEFFELIKVKFDLDFLKKILLIKNKDNQNFHAAMISNDVETSLEVLDSLIKVVGKDKEFFIELTTQTKLPDEIKEFFEGNFESKIKKDNCILM
jgi:hypothetical protein